MFVERLLLILVLQSVVSLFPVSTLPTVDQTEINPMPRNGEHSSGRNTPGMQSAVEINKGYLNDIF